MVVPMSDACRRNEEVPGAARCGQAADGSWRIERGRVTVTFVREGDRWGHTTGMDGIVVAQSVEGPWPPAGDERWPASPVVTEILEVATANGPALAGVGRVGRSHVSVCVAAEPRLPDTLLIEVACRIHDGPGWLGSTYRLPTAGAGSPGEHAESGLARHALLRIAAPVADVAGLPRTVCWSYRIGPAGIAMVEPSGEETPRPPVEG
jgi:hypothetical protein